MAIHIRRIAVRFALLLAAAAVIPLIASGATLATSRIGRPRVAVPAHTAVTLDGVALSPLRVDDDLLPTSIFAVHLRHLNQPAGWLVGEFSLEEMWRMVDRIRIGGHGYAMVIAPDGTLLAHGDPDKKALVAQARNMNGHPLVAAGDIDTAAVEYADAGEPRRLAV